MNFHCFDFTMFHLFVTYCFKVLRKYIFQLNYVLDDDREDKELIVKEGDVCLTREDFWTLGKLRWMESTVSTIPAFS